MDKKASVVELEGRCHDGASLSIGDASVFPAYPEKTPTLLDIALAWRMAKKLAGQARRGSCNAGSERVRFVRSFAGGGGLCSASHGLGAWKRAAIEVCALREEGQRDWLGAGEGSI